MFQVLNNPTTEEFQGAFISSVPDIVYLKEGRLDRVMTLVPWCWDILIFLLLMPWLLFLAPHYQQRWVHSVFYIYIFRTSREQAENNRSFEKSHGEVNDEAKEKIRASVKQVWAERVRSRLLEEKYMSLWSENIAEAARKGGYGQVKLYWDSYETIKQDFSYEQLQLSEEKARAKQETKMIAKQDAQASIEKKRRAAERKKERKKEHEEKGRREGNIRKLNQKRDNVFFSSLHIYYILIPFNLLKLSGQFRTFDEFQAYALDPLSTMDR